MTRFSYILNFPQFVITIVNMICSFHLSIWRFFFSLFFNAYFRWWAVVAVLSRFEGSGLYLNKLALFFWIVFLQFQFLYVVANLIGGTLKSLETLLWVCADAGDNFSLIAEGPRSIILEGWIIVVQYTSPYSRRQYIYVSSRWCLRMKRGVLLLMVILVLVILGAIYFFDLLPEHISSIQYNSNWMISIALIKN
jgi:hypothetical protein